MGLGTLVGRAQRGDRAALEELFVYELPPLRRWTMNYLPPGLRRLGYADDFVQAAVLRTLRRLPHLVACEKGTLQPYLRRVVINLTRDHLRTLRTDPLTLGLDQDNPATTGTALDELVASEAVRRYREAVSTLSRREQTALSARIEEGLPYAQVARAAGCASEAAARVMVGRALKRVIKLVTQVGSDRLEHNV